jgi:hypothetical protein cdivTM_09943
MEIIFYLLLTLFGIIIAVFLLTVLFGAPYVPTHKKELIKLFKAINLSKKDTLVDIGSGDGIVLKIASSFNARTIGFEINPFLVLFSKVRLRKCKNIQIYLKNFWTVFPIENITVFYTFGHQERIYKMLNLSQIQANAQKSPLLFISYGFEIKNLKPFKISGAHFVYKISPKK